MDLLPRWTETRTRLYRVAEAAGLFRAHFLAKSVYRERRERWSGDVSSAPRVDLRVGGVPAASHNLCVFASHSRDGALAPWVRHYVAALRTQLDCDIVFVSTSSIPAPDVEWLRAHCATVVVRENRGYDFGSWRVGLELSTDRSRYENLFIANDSVFGPVFGLGPMREALAATAPTMVGITEGLNVEPHLQSYLIGFNRAARSLPFFDRFWNGVEFFVDKHVVVRRYEIGLSAAARRDGCNVVPLYPFQRIREFSAATVGVPDQFRGRDYVNPSHVYWEALFLMKCPVMKVDLLRTNAWDVDLSRLRRHLAGCDYPADLVPFAGRVPES